ncbi:MAG: restriction endonuclease [Pseudomonadota bacterium]
MSDYDFKTLNDKEFEILCADLLSKICGQKFERFKPGRDLGVDGRFFSSSGREVVLQCKHWARTPTAQLIRELGLTEKAKLDRINPERCLLAVSNNLSRVDKKNIAKALNPHIKKESDIFGCEDLNDALKKNPDVERNHYKLWIHSTGVISNIVNRSIHGRSQDYLLDIQERSPRYAVTSNHIYALRKVNQLHVIIVTGEPGIGKTTLADQLCLYYVAQGFGIVKINDDIAEAESVFDEDTRQVFYFDDFLGRNYLEALRGHEGSKITNFIRRVARNKNKIFILTSRSTILNQGKVLMDIFHHENIERNEFEMRICSLSNLDKAMILYNHIWHSTLPPQFIDEIYKDQRYLLIIKHKNFNPRIISYIADASRLEEMPADEYWSYVEKSLASPEKIWENPFIAQQDDFSRALIVLTVFNGQSILEKDLLTAYGNYISFPLNQSMKGRRDFFANIKTLTGSFLNRFVGIGREVHLDLFNPSIGDYIFTRFSSDREALSCCFLSLKTSASLLTFASLIDNNRISKADAREIALSLTISIIDKDFKDHSFAYFTEVVVLIIERWNPDGELKARLLRICRKIFTLSKGKHSTLEMWKAVAWGMINNEINSEDALDYIQEHVCGSSRDELSACWQLFQSIPNTAGRRAVLALLKNFDFEPMLENIAEFVKISDAYDYNGFSVRDYDSDTKLLSEMINLQHNRRRIPLGRINGRSIMTLYDVADNLNGDLHSSHESDYNKTEGVSGSSQFDDESIHDLFDRS